MSLEQGRLNPLDLSRNGLPDVGNAMEGIFYPITAVTVQKQEIGGFVKEICLTVKTKGVVQPMRAQEVEIKYEGQRTWKYFTLHCLPNLNLKPDDAVIIKDTRYRCLGKEDYSIYGFIKFDLAEDYTETLS